MCSSLVEIRSVTSEIRRQKRKKKEEKNTAVKYKPFGIAMPCGLTTSSIVIAHVNPCDNVGGLGPHTTCHLLVSYTLGLFIFSFIFCFIFRLAPSPHRLTDLDGAYVIRRVSTQGSAFWGSR